MMNCAVLLILFVFLHHTSNLTVANNALYDKQPRISDFAGLIGKVDEHEHPGNNEDESYEVGEENNDGQLGRYDNDNNEHEVDGGEIEEKLWREHYMSENLEVIREKDVPFDILLKDFLQHIKELKDGEYWQQVKPFQDCGDFNRATPCVDENCEATVTTDPEESLKSVWTTMKDLDHDTLAEVSRLLKPKYTHKRVLFLTAASSNHFEESQALLQNLTDHVFPHLTNYSLVYYDLGLNTTDRSQLERFCNCEVRTFPLSVMPKPLQDLSCYTWKPLIINANIPTADLVVWVDASIRFYNGTILKILEDLEKKRVNVNWGRYAISHYTTTDMFDYFGEKTCRFSHVSEMEANFLSFKNDRFVRNAILKPWAACALSTHCMCPPNPASLLKCHMNRKYNQCHRFDQSALGIILVKLYSGYEQSLKVRRYMLEVKRRHTVKYFDELAKQSQTKLFKNFRYDLKSSSTSKSLSRSIRSSRSKSVSRSKSLSRSKSSSRSKSASRS